MNLTSSIGEIAAVALALGACLGCVLGQYPSATVLALLFIGMVLETRPATEINVIFHNAPKPTIRHEEEEP